MRHFIVIGRRMLLTSGIVVRTVTRLPHRRITHPTWQETFFGQLPGQGTFRIEFAGSGNAPVSDEDEDEDEPTVPRFGPPPAPTGRQDTEPIPRLPRS